MASPTTGPKPVTRLNTPGGQPDLVHDVGQDEGVERCHLAGLEHHGAAGGQRRGHLGGDLVERVVPGRDGSPTTPIGSRTTSELPDLLLPGEVGGHLGGRGERVERQPDLDDLGEDPGHAHFVGDEVGRARPSAAARASATLVSRRSARRRAGPTTPGRRRGRRGHGPVDVLGGPLGDGAHAPPRWSSR